MSAVTDLMVRWSSLRSSSSGGSSVINSSPEPLRYLCFSTMIEPEIAVYPDSGKYGLFAGAAPGTMPERRSLTKFIRQDAEVDYWDGEA